MGFCFLEFILSQVERSMEKKKELKTKFKERSGVNTLEVKIGKTNQTKQKSSDKRKYSL
jgi:hypothetical protein